jgi:hypothetical protein
MQAPKEAGEPHRWVAEEETEMSELLPSGPTRKGNLWLCLVCLMRPKLKGDVLLQGSRYLPQLYTVPSI